MLRAKLLSNNGLEMLAKLKRDSLTFLAQSVGSVDCDTFQTDIRFNRTSFTVLQSKHLCLHLGSLLPKRPTLVRLERGALSGLAHALSVAPQHRADPAAIPAMCAGR